MLKLMKYEFRKTLSAKLLLLGIAAALQIFFMISLYADKENALGISIVLLSALAFGGILMIGLYSVMTLHRDMNTKQSYMLFMTPNSSYGILGAKVLENGLSILLAGGFFFVLGVVDITLLVSHYGELNRIWEMFTHFIQSINSELQINASGLACLTFCMLAGWISTVTAAFLADVVSAALLNGKAHNGLISFLLFLLLAWFTGWIMQAATAPVHGINESLLAQGCVALLLSALMYTVTAEIMARKLSV